MLKIMIIRNVLMVTLFSILNVCSNKLPAEELRILNKILERGINKPVYFDFGAKSLQDLRFEPKSDKEEAKKYPLLFALDSGRLELVRAVLNIDGVDVNVTSDYEETALLLAAYTGKEDIVKELLGRNDIDVNKPNQEGQTPLLIVSYMGFGNIVEMLLKHEKIKVNQADEKGTTPLKTAALYKNEKILKMLLKHPDIKTLDPATILVNTLD